MEDIFILGFGWVLGMLTAIVVRVVDTWKRQKLKEEIKDEVA